MVTSMVDPPSSKPREPVQSYQGGPVILPGWFSIVVVLILAGLLLFLIWLGAEKLCVTPYTEYRQQGPILLAPLFPDTQIRVRYPRRIGPNVQGAAYDKRITVYARQLNPGPSEQIHLVVESVLGNVRLLTEEKRESTGHVVITATYGTDNLGSLWLEHVNVSKGNAISLTVQILPPTNMITQAVSVKALNFVVEEESLITGTIRRLVSLIPWQTFLLTLLALPGALLKTLWDRNRKMPDLYRQMQQAQCIDDIRTLYRQYQGMKFSISWRGHAVDFPGQIAIEQSYRRAEAQFHFKEAERVSKQGASGEAKEYLEYALGWDPDYAIIRELDERIHKIEEDYRRTENRAIWWLDPTPDTQTYQVLNDLLKNRRETHPVVRQRIIKILGHTNEPRAQRAVSKAMREDNDPFIQLLATQMLARRGQPTSESQKVLRAADPELVEEWLGVFPSPLLYNPFKVTSAELDDYQEEHFFQHYRYIDFLKYQFQHVALFADPGCGKTSCRLTFKAFLESSPCVIIDYVAFDALVRDLANIELEDHVRNILQQASPMLDCGSLSPNASWQTGIRQLLLAAQRTGHTVYILVNNVDAYAEAQSGPNAVENLLRHLVSNLDLLDVSRNPSQLVKLRSAQSISLWDSQYDIATVRTLIRAAFTADDLIRFLQDHDAFRPILSRFGPKFNFEDMIGAVIEYCHQQDLLQTLLLEIREHNPRQYERHHSELRHSKAVQEETATQSAMAPDLPPVYFKFFLPLSSKERLLRYPGFERGRIEVLEMKWDSELLQELLRARLRAASLPRSPADSLMAYVAQDGPRDLDVLLVEQAKSSPRRLIDLVNKLFQHRARTWDDSGRNHQELYVTMSDWASLLEYLSRS